MKITPYNLHSFNLSPEGGFENSVIANWVDGIENGRLIISAGSDGNDSSEGINIYFEEPDKE